MARCSECLKDFTAKPAEIARGGGRFCSLSCAAYSNNRRRPSQKVTLKCTECGKQYSVKKCRATKSKFCSRACQGLQKVTTGEYKARKEAFSALPNSCYNCRSKDDLVLHHLNNDHFDNRPQNWRIVCRRCHLQVYHPENSLNAVRLARAARRRNSLLQRGSVG